MVNVNVHAIAHALGTPMEGKKILVCLDVCVNACVCGCVCVCCKKHQILEESSFSCFLSHMDVNKQTHTPCATA